MARKQRRKKDEVKTDIFNSITSILKKYGYSKLGINMIAKEANIDKTVIYRHFNSFDELLFNYIERNDIWVNDKLPVTDDMKVYIKTLLTNLSDKVSNSEEIKQLVAWSLIDRSPILDRIAVKREESTAIILNHINEYFSDSDIDINAIAGLLISGIYYINLNETIVSHCKLDVDTKKGKDRIKKSIEYLVDLIITNQNKNKVLNEITINAYREGLDFSTIQKITGLELKYIEKLVKAE